MYHMHHITHSKPCFPSDIQTPKVRNYLLDLLVLLLHEGEIVSPDILDSLLTNIIDPVKVSSLIYFLYSASFLPWTILCMLMLFNCCYCYFLLQSSNRPVYTFTVELIRKASSYIEPHLHKVSKSKCKTILIGVSRVSPRSILLCGSFPVRLQGQEPCIFSYYGSKHSFRKYT